MSRPVLKLFVYVLLAGLTALPGCMNDGRKLELKGKVTDEKTGVFLPGRRIILQRLIPSGKKEIPEYAGQCSTDSSGNFNFTLHRSKNTYFYNFSLAGDSSYAFTSRRLGLYDLKTNGKFLTFTMPRLALLAISIEKNSRTPANDILYVSWRSFNREGKALYPWKVENYGTPPDVALRWKGPNVRSVIRTKVFAEKRTTVFFDLIRNDKKTEYSRTIYCNRDGDNYVNFKY